MTYTCPVCGYDKLTRPATDFNICKSCGTEFGYHDSGHTYEELREQWRADGMKWHSRRTPPPLGWNPIAQLLKAGYGYSLAIADTNFKPVAIGAGAPRSYIEATPSVEINRRDRSNAGSDNFTLNAQFQGVGA